MEHYSPLRYPGGKGKMADYFKGVIKDNLLYGGTYVEPYAGGASVALSLLFNDYVQKIVINDIDYRIYAFWHSVVNRPKAFCKLIETTPVNMKSWRKQLEIYRAGKKYGLLKVGFATFFLNRTNRSGILDAGVIGGVAQNGKWKMDARYYKETLMKRIQKIGEYKDRIEIYNLDAVELIRFLRPTLPEKTLIYFDPPYYVKGKDLYLNFYESDDHQMIVEEIDKLKKPRWIVTYDDVKPIKTLYKKYRKATYYLNYSAAKVGKGKEVMFFSENLCVSKRALKEICK
ncbi:DNA methyltransferase [Bdellovibrio bacteriovorus]|uniref:site-specific DNA-methyltransferase (adenine-specific) n=1 Tax=Bdellovibrio bacteriovorus TaxID=959 RepID=A0A162GR64_BDEBC|nr:DNA adenine methylase [Bdellovibrio bacteriovorus]KYG68755.1 DNA methyltransferase [Bdellovibrio bacteriovorus]